MDISKVISMLDDFPTLPTIYSQLLEIMANPHSTVIDIAKVIEQDQASALKVLKTVNSSMYGLQVKVSSISQAIFHLGFNEVKNLVIGLSLINMFSKTSTFTNFNLVDFWRHSIGVGTITRILGNTLNVPNVEDYFLAGIIHDIGKLFFIKFMPEEYVKSIEEAYQTNMPISKIENKNFGFNHHIAGELIASKWKLPETIRKSVKYHSVGMVDGQYNKLVACVHLSNIIARMMNMGTPGDNMIPEPNYGLWDYLNFKPKQISDMRDKILIDYEQSTAILLLKNS